MQFPIVVPSPSTPCPAPRSSLVTPSLEELRSDSFSAGPPCVVLLFASVFIPLIGVLKDALALLHALEFPGSLLVNGQGRVVHSRLRVLVCDERWLTERLLGDGSLAHALHFDIERFELRDQSVNPGWV